MDRSQPQTTFGLPYYCALLDFTILARRKSLLQRLPNPFPYRSPHIVWKNSHEWLFPQNMLAESFPEPPVPHQVDKHELPGQDRVPQ